MKITVADPGYVGLSLAGVLAKRNSVAAIDVLPERVERVNQRLSPLHIKGTDDYLAADKLNLTAALDEREAYVGAEYVIIAVPTDYDAKWHFFNTSAVENVIELAMHYCPDAVIVIRSTVPAGYTEAVRKEIGFRNILFSPEFLRESSALYDTLHPGRIIAGADLNDAGLTEAANRFTEDIRYGLKAV